LQNALSRSYSNGKLERTNKIQQLARYLDNLQGYILGIKQITHSHYSLHLAFCNFWLIEHIKKNLRDEQEKSLENSITKKKFQAF
jgi:hypothetical protein